MFIVAAFGLDELFEIERLALFISFAESVEPLSLVEIEFQKPDIYLCFILAQDFIEIIFIDIFLGPHETEDNLPKLFHVLLVCRPLVSRVKFEYLGVYFMVKVRTSKFTYQLL